MRLSTTRAALESWLEHAEELRREQEELDRPDIEDRETEYGMRHDRRPGIVARTSLHPVRLGPAGGRVGAGHLRLVGGRSSGHPMSRTSRTIVGDR
jgi:hypothetical protein